MRFVAVKSAEQQGQSMLLKTRDLFLEQRTQMMNALRGHLAEFGIVAAQGPANLKKLEDVVVSCPESELPVSARNLCIRLFDHIRHLDWQVEEMTKRIEAAAKQMRRLDD